MSIHVESGKSLVVVPVTNDNDLVEGVLLDETPIVWGQNPLEVIADRYKAEYEDQVVREIVDDINETLIVEKSVLVEIKNIVDKIGVEVDSNDNTVRFIIEMLRNKAVVSTKWF